MAKFVTQSFPKIARKHNAFSDEMNEETDSNEHEGHTPVMFPIVPKPEVQLEEDAATDSKTKKRKRAPAETTALPFREAMPSTKAKSKPDTQLATTPTSTTTTPPPSLPTQSPNPGLHPFAQPQSTRTETLFSSTQEPSADDTPPVTPESNNAVDAEQGPFLDHKRFDWNLRHSSPLSGSPSSLEGVGNEREIVEEPPIHSKDDRDHQLPEDDTPRQPMSAEDEDNEHNPIPPPATPSLENPDSKMSDVIDTAMKEPEAPIEEDNQDQSSAEFDSVLLSEDECWENGIQVIEGFRWNRSGSRWEPGRGLVSIHYDSIEKSARLFRGYYWNDGNGTTLEGFRVDPEPDEFMKHMS
ncbi:hypothetical protein BU25DRAFT_117417 [Macroventuria anomochaeta]|uniref:Uncharacterized protein n=1 Tax=Macroventuria anomochaeta TaxID=301207 RepID=A0ACB6RTX2_9PLEO|nr:uncharacterized protein BU25DRAFT_117417 [Macroventuria anomochaeta]KAF2625248.1 hypothetical protein BU25DRAFT_117417 [Macroventuria anomochaeta]